MADEPRVVVPLATLIVSQPIAYNVTTAAEATGVSVDTIRRAIRAGDLRAHRPRVDNNEFARDLITAEELRRWVISGR